ncbi:UNVERIFIED_CONTAM: hypothetical protein Sradi_1520400 [Sesamum radiatum]|uniref:Uncharacterized protein n=1 Tax=Sesamum radiatum TaxID=300843 RepID=A0AAW2U8G2_SESRA
MGEKNWCSAKHQLCPGNEHPFRKLILSFQAHKATSLPSPISIPLCSMRTNCGVGSENVNGIFTPCTQFRKINEFPWPPFIFKDEQSYGSKD